MKNRIVNLVGVCALAIAMIACGNKENNVTPTPTEAVEFTATPTVAPTVTPTPTPEPTVTPTPKVKDTYEPGTVTEDKFTSKWMNLRFTRQKGFELGTEDGLEMYAQCIDGARMEIYTELLPEEYLEMQEVDYLTVLEEELKQNGFTVVNKPDIIQGLIGKEYFAGVDFVVEDENGQMSFASFALKKKESRMIIISSTFPYSESAVKSYNNMLRSFGAYYSNPITLPEEELALVSFDSGLFTENCYENKWVNLRITAPERAKLAKNDYPVLDSVYGEIEWEDGRLPYIQYGIDYADNRTTDEYLIEQVNYFNSQISGHEEGWVYVIDEQIKTELLGGQEYKVMTAVLSRPELPDRVDEYYCRVQDKYGIFIMFEYNKESEEQIKEAKSLFTEY